MWLTRGILDTVWWLKFSFAAVHGWKYEKKYEKDQKPEGYRPISRLQDFLASSMGMVPSLDPQLRLIYIAQNI